MGFSRQEYRSGLPLPSPGELPEPGVEPMSPVLAGGFFTTEPPETLTFRQLDALTSNASDGSTQVTFHKP